MTAIESIDRNAATRKAPAAATLATTPDDMVMLRAAAELAREFARAKGAVYWPDFLASAALGYGALATVILSGNIVVALIAALVAMLALYRAESFIHELTHIRKGALPGFRFGWNLLVGIPLLTPSFLYEGVHTQHHAKTRYGTVDDPEYLPLALMKPWSLPLFIVVAALAPIALLFRFAVLTPLALIVPGLRRTIDERYSALSINPAYRRRPPEGAFKRMWRWQEAGASLWAIGILSASAAYGWRPLLIALAVFSGMAVINQLRTLVAHLWENEGEAMTVTGQYLDSVNVPPPGILAEGWAPVGLRYHALHHLLPSVPYHALAQAHRRLAAVSGTDSTYARSNHRGMIPLVARIARSTMGGDRART